MLPVRLPARVGDGGQGGAPEEGEPGTFWHLGKTSLRTAHPTPGYPAFRKAVGVGQGRKTPAAVLEGPAQAGARGGRAEGRGPGERAVSTTGLHAGLWASARGGVPCRRRGGHCSAASNARAPRWGHLSSSSTGHSGQAGSASEQMSGRIRATCGQGWGFCLPVQSAEGPSPSPGPPARPLSSQRSSLWASYEDLGQGVGASAGDEGLAGVAGHGVDGLLVLLAVGRDLLHARLVVQAPQAQGAVMAS